jgi:hypothetical protein
LSMEPLPSAAFAGLTFVEADGGSNHTCIRADSGETWCWGSELTGELGAGHVIALGAFPVRVVNPGG